MELKIINKIYSIYEKERVRDIHIERNDNWRGDYFVWFDVLDDNNCRIHYIFYYDKNSDELI